MVLAVGLGVLLTLAVSGQASFRHLSSDELRQRSQVIATGRLIGITPLKLPGSDQDWRLGVLRLDKVFRGEPQATALIVLPPADPKVVTSDRTDYSVGASGLWYLRPYAEDSRGLYQADHPQRLLPNNQPEKLQQRIEQLSR